jgi:hypothetical protein
MVSAASIWHAMAQWNENYILTGIVELDDTYFGGTKILIRNI